MAQQKSIYASASWTQRQGSYGTNKNKTISLTFSDLSDLKDKVIVSAILYLQCSAGGLNKEKTLDITLGSIYCGEHTTTSAAYNQTTTVVLSNNDVANWIKSGNYSFTSVDPNANSLSYTSSDGSKYSRNYLVISNAGLTITYEEGTSDFSLSPSTLYVCAEKDYSSRLTLSNHINGYTYDVNLIMDNEHTYSLIEGASSSSFDIAIYGYEEGLCDEILKDKIQATGTLKLIAYYNGEEKYTKTQIITVALTDPETNGYLPTLAAILSASETSTVINEKYYLLTGKSKLKAYLACESFRGATITQITAQYTDESTIYYFTLDDLENNLLTIPAPSFSGTKNVKFIATDSRGYSIERVLQNLYASPYVSPTFFSTSITRTNSSGETSPVNGTYAKISYVSSYTTFVLDMTGTNEYTNTINVSLSQANSTWTSYSSGYNIGGSFKTSDQYLFSLTITDDLGSTFTKTLLLPSSAYLLHFAKDSNSVAIGTVAEASDEGLFTVAWNSIFKKDLNIDGKLTVKDLNLTEPLTIGNGGTGAASQSGAFTQIVSPGGTITGELILQNGGGSESTTYLTFKGGSGISRVTSGVEYNTSNTQRQFFFDYGVAKYTLPIHTNIVDGNSYEILTTKDYGAIHKAGDTLSITEAYAYGWIAASGRKIYLCFPLGCSIPDLTISVEQLTGIVRCYGNYCATLEGLTELDNKYDFLNSSSIETYWVKEQKVLKISITCSSQLSVSNCTVSYIGSLSLSFN